MIVSHATFLPPGVITCGRLDEVGLEAAGHRLGPGLAVLECRAVDPDDWCRSYGAPGIARGTVTRPLAHEPPGWRPTTLLVRVRRYRCTGCGRVRRQDISETAPPRPGPARAKISRRELGWALRSKQVFKSWLGGRPKVWHVADNHAEVEAIWGIYQRVIAAYRERDGSQGKQLMHALVARSVPALSLR